MRNSARAATAHDYPITAEEAKNMGLAISTEMPDRVIELMTMYPQQVRQTPGGVEYLPMPRHKEAPQ